jgi:hypothetical protein
MASAMMKTSSRRSLYGWNGASRLALPGALASLLLATPSLSIVAGVNSADTTGVQTSPAVARLLESKIRALSGSEAEAPTSFQPIVITEGEANAYLKYHGRELLPPGVRDPAIRITRERVSGVADVDFAEFSRTSNKADAWGPKVLAAMFKGKQRVTAVGTLATYNGRGVVKIERVSVGATAMPNWLVDFVLENYLQPRYNFDLSRPFVLPDHVTRIELDLGQATFFRSPNKQPKQAAE